MSQKRRNKWKKTRRAALGHHLVDGRLLLHSAPVRVMAKQNQFKIEWRSPKPAYMKVDQRGITFLRGEDPQDDSVLRGRPSLHFPWSSVTDIRFNKWIHSAVRIDLRAGEELEKIFVQWLSDSSVAPYDVYETDAVYRLLALYRERYGGEKIA